MKIFNVTHPYGSFQMVVARDSVIMTARILQSSEQVVSFYVEGMNIPNQQKEFGCNNFSKWLSPIQQ